MATRVPATPAATVLVKVLDQRDEAARQAWTSLSRYKFQMFGYHAAKWVTFNQLLPRHLRQSNPWKALVQDARSVVNVTKKLLDTKEGVNR